jgi:guanylate kinase
LSDSDLIPPQRGHLYVIAAPSGAGKTTLVHRLLQADDSLRFSISYTTRPQRHTEKNAKDYFFVSPAAFQAMVNAGDFLEHATVFRHRYGTSKNQVEALLNSGYKVILEIDWQGARQVRNHMPDCRSIFILPPSLVELRHRLTARGTDSAAVINLRFQEAVADLSHWQEFDYAIINDHLDQALQELAAIAHGAGEANATSNPELIARVSAILQQS